MERNFSLPNLEDLSKRQEAIRALPLKGQHLIVGGPGTGKSVVALFRVKKLKNENKDYACLAYNHLLLKSNQQLAVEEISSQQWQSWFNQIYKNTLSVESVPRPANQNDGFHDWQAILHNINQYIEQNPKPDFSERFLVIDEGQDMPIEFYQALIALGFENFFIVADQNQQIGQHNSSLNQLRQEMGLDVDDVHTLVDNYRNSHAVALFSQHFYTDPASPKAELPPQDDVQKPAVYGYDGGHDGKNFTKVIEKIAINAKNEPDKLIGVISPTQDIGMKYTEALQKIINANGWNIKTTYYDSKNRTDIRFNEGGIMVINAQACKGLEFDTVFLADVNSLLFNPIDIDGFKKRLYVMTTRTKKRLFLLIDKSRGYKHILDLLPNDDNIVEIRNVW